jgi:hypothetical protein
LGAAELLLFSEYPLTLPFGGWLFAESWSSADRVNVGGGDAKLEKELL